MKRDYQDILYMTHPISPKHPPMSMKNRAAQFAPFSALNGHHAMVNATIQRFNEEYAQFEKYTDEEEYFSC